SSSTIWRQAYTPTWPFACRSTSGGRWREAPPRRARVKVHRDLAEGAGDLRDPVATIGNFDGLHRVRQAIFDQDMARAWERPGTSLVITFDPHPLKILAPGRAPRTILTPGQKLRRFEEAGIDVVLVLPFDARLAAVSAESFVDDYLWRGLGLREVY